MVELYKKHRPAKFRYVLGQETAVKMLNDMGKRHAIPHCLLLGGPSGCGKTTVARILAKKLGCSKFDLRELNLADTRGIEEARKIRSQVPNAPMGGGKSRVWILDEVHRTTPDFQNAMLKLLEDTPSHVYFILCTTEPQRLLNTVRTRATEVMLKALTPECISTLVYNVAKIEMDSPREGLPLEEEVVDRIVEMADGSARKALVLLESILGEKESDGQLKILDKGAVRNEAIQLARFLVKGGTFADIASVLNGIDGLEGQAESIRRLVLSYMSTVALKNPGKVAKMCLVIDAFSEPFFYTGRAGLILACHEVVSGTGV